MDAKAKSAITPEIVAEHGLKPDEYQRLLQILGREPSGDTDTDDTPRRAGQIVERGFKPHSIAATCDGLDVGAGDDASFALQASGGEDHHMPWSTRRTLPRLRLRKRARAHSGKNAG